MLNQSTWDSYTWRSEDTYFTRLFELPVCQCCVVWCKADTLSALRGEVSPKQCARRKPNTAPIPIQFQTTAHADTGFYPYNGDRNHLNLGKRPSTRGMRGRIGGFSSWIRQAQRSESYLLYITTVRVAPRLPNLWCRLSHWCNAWKCIALAYRCERTWQGV